MAEELLRAQSGSRIDCPQQTNSFADTTCSRLAENFATCHVDSIAVLPAARDVVLSWSTTYLAPLDNNPLNMWLQPCNGLSLHS